jgi:hypothetical protein
VDGLSYSTKPGETFIAKVRLNWIDTLDDNVEPQVEFLLINEEGVIDVPLYEKVVGESRPGQLMKLSHKENAISTPAF